MGGLESDPWGSPELHRNHNHEAPPEPRTLNGYGSVRSTNNAWSGNSIEGTGQPEVAREDIANQNAGALPSSSGSGWDGNPAVPEGLTGFDGPSRGFAPGDPNPLAPPSAQRRPIGITRTVNNQVEEFVTINLLNEKEGVFMFQHRNYEVKSTRRGSTVVRRYSDFVWLLDCLQKRFPFRQLPLLPPKRVSGMSYAGSGAPNYILTF